ncbi:MAG: septal ring lytic transglycosylase RlpA family protein [Hyphomicrobiaceae bacterium]
MAIQLKANARRSLQAAGFAVATATAALTFAGAVAEAKLPGKTHCYFGICHRVKTLPETERLVGSKTVVTASFYDDCKVDRFNPCTLTSSGEVFKPHRPDNAASPIYPDGTQLLLWNPKTKSAAIVRVNSAGPYHGKRTLDVSRATAEKLGFKRSGVAQLHVQILKAPTVAESRYKKHRTYAAVAGPIGNFGSFEMASADGLRRVPGVPATNLIASATVPTTLKLTSLPLSSAKAVNAASRNATMAVMASAAGVPGPTTTLSASAVLMNSVPHSLLPPGVLTDGRGSGRKAPAPTKRAVLAAVRS